MSGEIQPLSERADALLKRIQSGGEHEALAKEIGELYETTQKLGEAAAPLKQRVAKLIVLNQNKGAGVTLPVPHDQLVTYLGTLNQYGGLSDGTPPLRGSTLPNGPNSSCTSCAQCFLARVLPKGTGCSIQSSEINEIVLDGYRNFDLLLKIKIKEAQAHDMPIPIAQAMDTAECSDVYGLKVLNAGGGKAHRILKKGGDGTTLDFFRELLQEFQESIGKRNALGGVIHSQGKTYALALFQTQDSFEWVLFDSHGHPEWNGGNPAAYIKHTDSLEHMAQCLSTLIEYKSCDPSYLSPAEIEQIEGEENDFILYAVEHEDHVLLAEKGELPVIPVIGPNHRPLPEEVNKAQQIAFIILVVAALGVTYKYYLSRQIPHEVTKIPTKPILKQL